MRILLAFLVILFLAFPALAASVELEWDAPIINADGSPLVDLAGYNVYMRTEGGTYSMPLDTVLDSITPSIVTYLVTSPLPEGKVYLVVTAFDTSGNESTQSNEVSVEINNVPPGNPTNLRIRIIR